MTLFSLLEPDWQRAGLELLKFRGPCCAYVISFKFCVHREMRKREFSGQWGCGSYAAAAAKSLQSCPTLCDPIDGRPPGSRPWDSPGKNTGVGCHFLLQCMKVKSESEVTQSCPTLCNPMDCSLPGSSIHGIFQARVLEWGAIAFSVGAILLAERKWPLPEHSCSLLTSFK